MKARVVEVDRFRHTFSCCEPEPCEAASNVGIMLDIGTDEVAEIRARLQAGERLVLVRCEWQR